MTYRRPQEEPPIDIGRRPARLRWFIFLSLAAVAVILIALFPAALRFVEMAAREARYLWWLILIVALSVWLIFGYGKRGR